MDGKNDFKNLEWKELGKKTLIETPVFRVTERESQGPDGQKAT